MSVQGVRFDDELVGRPSLSELESTMMEVEIPPRNVDKNRR